MHENVYTTHTQHIKLGEWKITHTQEELQSEKRGANESEQIKLAICSMIRS